MPFKFSESTRRDGRRERRFDEKNPDGEHFRKLFVGGLSYETTKEDLDKHFGEYGAILDSVVMIYPDSKRSRGFGFVTFDSITSVDAVQEARPHVLDGREVETKRATPREQNTGRDSSQCIKKLFIGGVPEEATEEDIRTSCEEFGRITEVDIIKHRDTGKPRGFCFVTFDDYDPIDKICMKGFVQILEKKVEVKKATPKDAVRRDRFGGSDRYDRGGGGGGGYFGDRGERDNRYNERDNHYGDDRRERYRSRSPVRYDRYSGGGGRSAGASGGGYGGGMTSTNYNQAAQSSDSLNNLSQLAPALASLGTLMGLLSNNNPGGSGATALNQLVSALGAQTGSSAAIAAPYTGDSGATRSASYSDRDNSGYPASSSYNTSSGYGAAYSSNFNSGYGGRGAQKDDYTR